MPKMKDLGINVIPETMRPPECLPLTVGPVCPPGSATLETTVVTTTCLPWTIGPVCTPFGFTHGCLPTSCGVSPAAQADAFQSTATCIPNSCGVACGCTNITNPCIGCTNAPTVAACANHTTITICHLGSYCGPISLFMTYPTPCHGGTYCPGGSICTTGSVGTITITPTTPQIQGGGLTRESIAQLKEQLQQQIAQLDEHAKTLGPKTADEIDAREQQLKAELADLATRRSDLKKSK